MPAHGSKQGHPQENYPSGSVSAINSLPETGGLYREFRE